MKIFTMSELNSRRSSIAIVTAKENLSELTQQQTFLRLGSLLGFLRVVSPSGPRQWFAKSRSPVRIWVPPFQMTVKAVVRSTTGRDVFVIASRPFLSMCHRCCQRTVRTHCFCRTVTTAFVVLSQLLLPWGHDCIAKAKVMHRVGKSCRIALAMVVRHVHKRYRYRDDKGDVGLAF